MAEPGLKDLNRMAFKARAALVFYELEDGDTANEGNSNQDCVDYYDSGPSAPKHFVSIHRIRGGELCEGLPLTKRKLLNLCRNVVPALGKGMTYIPEHVINYRQYPTTLIWWRPAGVKHLFFDEGTGIPSGSAPLPPLIFRYNGMGLTTFALKENRRPTPATELWGTIWSNFGCLGQEASSRLPKAPRPDQTEYIEDLFFRAAFNDHNPASFKGITYEALWKSLVGSGKTKFPLKHLVKVGHVGDLFKRGSDEYTD